MKEFKISYFYHASGMELGPDIFPETIVTAPTKEMAAYLYYITYFADYNSGEKNPNNFANVSFQEFQKEKDVYKYWGLTIEEL